MKIAEYILIVEDDDWLAAHHERILTGAGYVVNSVPHAIAAIESIDVHRPDVLIADVFLAGPNAFTLLHELQSHSDFADIPVILCTNIAHDIAGEDIALYGIRRVLDKTTMQPQDLIAAVRSVNL